MRALVDETSELRGTDGTCGQVPSDLVDQLDRVSIDIASGDFKIEHTLSLTVSGEAVRAEQIRLTSPSLTCSVADSVATKWNINLDPPPPIYVDAHGLIARH